VLPAILPRMPPAKQKGAGYDGKRYLRIAICMTTSWRIHLTTAIFPHHGAMLMLQSTTFDQRILT
jgi:hypothetical protein